MSNWYGSKMNISYEYYRVFYYVAKYRNITKAAEVLTSNQPNVTRLIKALEQNLECTLFVRSHKGVVLTPEGEALYAHVKIAVENILAGEEELAHSRSLQRGIISIGASEVALRCLLLPILNRYRHMYPGVQIRISNHSTPQAISALQDGLADIAVVTTPLDHTDKIDVIKIREFQECAVCGDAYRSLTAKPLSFSDLADVPLICLSPGTKTYTFYTELFARYDLTIRPDIEAATADQILPMVRNNLGIGFVPKEFLSDLSENTGVHVLTLTQEIPPRSICLVRNREIPFSIAAKELQKMILDAGASYQK